MSRISELIQQRDALAAQQAALDKALRELQGAERQATLDKIRTMMAEHGITVADLSAAEGRKAKGRPPKGSDGRSASAGKPVAAKYRHTTTGEDLVGPWPEAEMAERRDRRRRQARGFPDRRRLNAAT